MLSCSVLYHLSFVRHSLIDDALVWYSTAVIIRLSDLSYTYLYNSLYVKIIVGLSCCSKFNQISVLFLIYDSAMKCPNKQHSFLMSLYFSSTNLSNILKLLMPLR